MRDLRTNPVVLKILGLANRLGDQPFFNLIGKHGELCVKLHLSPTR